MTPEEKDKLKKEIEELDERLQRSNEKDKETEHAILSVFDINWTKSKEVVLISLIFLTTEILSDF